MENLNSILYHSCFCSHFATFCDLFILDEKFLDELLAENIISVYGKATIAPSNYPSASIFSNQHRVEKLFNILQAHNTFPKFLDFIISKNQAIPSHPYQSFLSSLSATLAIYPCLNSSHI
jgi:hypothetical protein